MIDRSLRRTALLAGALAAVTPLWADAGHDHGAAPPATRAAALPRFAATSELFELVGVLDGRQLTLYLDRADDNSPVRGARLELELAGAKVAVQTGAEGEFTAQLAQEPKPGVASVAATVYAGAETDLLAGELEVHAAAPAAADQARDWRFIGAWTATVVALAGALAWLARRARVAHAARVARIGGAA